MMKRWIYLIFSCALLAISSTVNGQTDDGWRFGLSFDGGMVVTGFLHELPRDMKREAYPTCISITWKSPSGAPIPIPQQPVALGRFSDFLKQNATTDAGAVLVVISLGLTQRKWIVYAKPDSDMPRKIEEAAQREKDISLAIGSLADPEWRQYEAAIPRQTPK